MKIKQILPVVAFASMSIATMAQEQLKSGIDLSNLNREANPATDFYEFACGGWMRNNPLPAAYSRFGSFDQLGENNNKRINSILNDLRNNTYASGTTECKLSDLYKLAMDSVRRNKDGVKPIMPIIRKLEKAKTVDALFKIQLELAANGDNEFFSAYIGADDKNASMNILNINQGGITLRQKEYYLDEDTATVVIRDAYKKHIVRMFKLFGFSEKAAILKMKNIMKLETELAKSSKSMTELRNPEANYNKISLNDFKIKYPHIKLVEISNASGLKTEHIQELVVGQPDFIECVDKLIANISPDEYRSIVFILMYQF